MFIYVDISCCVANSVRATRYLYMQISWWLLWRPHFFLPTYASLPCTTTNTRSLSLRPRVPAPFSNNIHLDVDLTTLQRSGIQLWPCVVLLPVVVLDSTW